MISIAHIIIYHIITRLNSTDVLTYQQENTVIAISVIYEPGTKYHESLNWASAEEYKSKRRWALKWKDGAR